MDGIGRFRCKCVTKGSKVYNGKRCENCKFLSVTDIMHCVGVYTVVGNFKLQFVFLEQSIAPTMYIDILYGYSIKHTQHNI